MDKMTFLDASKVFPPKLPQFMGYKGFMFFLKTCMEYGV